VAADGFDLFIAYRHCLRGKQLYYTVVAVMCVAREPDGKSFECSDYSSCRRKYDACGARVIFLKQNIFILLARHADGQLHSHTTFLQCSAASPLSLRWRSKRKTSPSYHVVRFAGNEFKRINKGEKNSKISS